MSGTVTRGSLCVQQTVKHSRCRLQSAADRDAVFRQRLGPRPDDSWTQPGCSCIFNVDTWQRRRDCPGGATVSACVFRNRLHARCNSTRATQSKCLWTTAQSWSGRAARVIRWTGSFAESLRRTATTKATGAVSSGTRCGSSSLRPGCGRSSLADVRPAGWPRAARAPASIDLVPAGVQREGPPCDCLPDHESRERLSIRGCSARRRQRHRRCPGRPRQEFGLERSARGVRRNGSR